MIKITPSLSLIDLDQTMTGFRKFIASWLYHDKNVTFLVDPGPVNSIGTLFQALKAEGITHLDYILLTHIHIDHAGGTGRLLEVFPMAKVICHEKGIQHMISPEKLWQGSLKVLGKIAEGYGEIVPVPSDKISYSDEIDLGSDRIIVLKTPGHAVHHLCYCFKGLLFAGEVSGVIHKAGDRLYARPATPPVFKLDVSLASLDLVLRSPFDKICFGHYGYYENPRPILEKAREQLVNWVQTVETELGKGEEDLIERIIRSLESSDELLNSYSLLEEDIKEREHYFIRNSIKGMVQYVQSLSQEQ